MSTEVVHQSWFSRLGKSVVGVLFGIGLFIGAIILLAWNEGRAVKTATGLKEGAATVVSLDKPSALEANNGHLIHANGVATTENVLKDPFFKTSVKAIQFRRTVEMFQWKENSKEETKTNLGGSTDTTTTYTYEKVWSEKLISSSDFHDAGHKNPPDMPLRTLILVADPVTLGEFTLNQNLAEGMDRFVLLPVPENPPKGFKAEGDWLYKAADPDAPEIGNLRVKFEKVKPAGVSVVALQKGAELLPYRTKSNTSINMLAYGTVSAEEMFAEAQRANTFLTWILRGVGFFLLFLGGCLISSPIGVLADVIPFLGGIARFGTSLLALIVALPVGLITVALAWLAYRPLLGVSLLILAIGLPVALFMMKRNQGGQARV